MDSENGNNATSQTNHANLENTHHEPTHNVPTRAAMATRMEKHKEILEQKTSTREQQEHKEQYLYYQQGEKEKNPETLFQPNAIPEKQHLTRKEQKAIEKLFLKTHEQNNIDATLQRTEVYTCPTCGRKYASEKTVTDTEPKE